MIAHEVTHALQDEHFHLTRGAFAPHPRDHDGELAAQALAEGDATDVQSRYVAELSPGDLVSELARTLGSLPSDTGGSVPYLQRELLYPYTAGQDFVRALRTRGGQRLLDRAFRHPPRTTAAVLDPSRYLAGDPPAQAVSLPAGSYDLVTTFGAEDLIALTGEDAFARSWLGGRLGVGPRGLELRLATREAGSVAAALERALPATAAVAFRGQIVCVRVAAHKSFSAARFLPIGNAVEPSPGRGEAESAAERRLHAVVDTLGLHVYSGQTHPDDRFVTLVALTPSRSLLGLPSDGTRSSDEKWVSAIHPDDRERYDEVFCYANERLLHPLELEYRLCGYDGVERWVWERIFPHRLRPDGVVDIDGVVADVTALHEATNERNELSQRLERVLGGVAEFVVSCELHDGRTVWTDAGPGAERMLGGPLPEGADGPTVWYECVHPDDRPVLDDYLERLAQREPAEATYRLRGLDGVERWVWARARPHPGDGPVAYDAVISDVTERERARIGLQLAREEAERRSRVDPTTGLFNRHHLLDVARRELARSQRENTSPALVLLDVDRLRELNERRGHAVGDAVLRELAGRLSHSVRTYDTISHVGGGRFAVLVPDLRDGEALRRICAEIAASLTQEPLRSAGREVHVTVSAGGARSHPGRRSTRCCTPPRSRSPRPSATAPASRPSRTAGSICPRTTPARPCASRPRSPAPPRCARACRTSTRSASPSSPSSSAASSDCPRACRAICAWPGCCTTSARSPSPAPCSPSPGRSTRRSGSLLREHPSIGADMVARIPGLARTQLAIRHHHERFDGEGYPDRLAGESIPMAARVLAAVDAYTAMTEIRPYRDARDRAEALEEVRRNAGTQLDPAVVDALCRVLSGENADAVAA